MRERSTWNPTQIKKEAAKRLSAAEGNDIYTINQDHPQPGWDDYVSGDSSDFAEDVHSPNTWEQEYSGDKVKRNEIGMPEYRPDTWNHSEKTAGSRALLLKKADLCVDVATMMLEGTRVASSAAIEDQAVALMYMPDQELIDTHKRLAAEQDEEEEEEEEDDVDQEASDDQDEDDGDFEQEASDDEDEDEEEEEDDDEVDQEASDDEDEDDEPQQKQARRLFAEDESEDDEDESESEGQEKQAMNRFAEDEEEAEEESDEEESPAQQKEARLVAKALKEGNFEVAHKRLAKLISATKGRSAAQQQQILSQMQQLLQQAQQQQAPMDPVGFGQDEIDQVLQQDAPPPVAEADIEIEPYPMDGDADLDGDDEVLRTLFAQDQQDDGEEEEPAAPQQKEARVSRTASTRTVGTRPTGGVSKIGGAVSSGSPHSVDSLSTLWQSAPDVRETFGLK